MKCFLCLNNAGVNPDKHIILTDYDLKKKFNSRLNPEDELEVYNKIVNETIKLQPLESVV